MRYTSFRTSMAVYVAILLLPTAGLAIAQDSPPVAVILKLNGVATVARASDGVVREASILDHLYQGDRVVTKDDASIEIFFSGSFVVTLESNSGITISAAPMTLASNMTPEEAEGNELLDPLNDLIFHSTSDGRMAPLGGLRNDEFDESEEEIVLVSPRNTKIKTKRPAFMWSFERPFERFKVKLFNSDGLVWSREVTGNHMLYPEDARSLEHDTEYYWQVEGEELLESTESPITIFQVISDELLNEVTSNESRTRHLFGDEPLSSNYQLVLGAFYAKEGLIASAITCFKRIAELHPEAALPHELLYQLYDEIGLEEEADAARQRASARGNRD